MTPFANRLRAAALFLGLAAAVVAGAAGEDADPAIRATLDALDHHLERHAEAEAADVYKLLHHSVMGPGHAVDSTAGARAWLERELAELEPAPPAPPAPENEPVCEPLGGEPALLRIHLRPFIAGGGDPDALVEAFVESANSVAGDRDRLARLATAAVEHLSAGGRADLATELGALVAERRAGGFPATRHSEAFRQRYHPAYRLVRRDLAKARGLCDDDAASPSEETHPTMHATGSFDVKLAPLDTYSADADDKIGRMSIDKTFAGDLAGTSRGEMLSGGSPAEGSAGYVAIERVTGTLGGRSGSFLLQHSGTMTPESQQLTITVIPGSGTGELAGIEGSMTIRREGGAHFYDFEYTLPE